MFKIHRGLSPNILRGTFISKASLHNFRRYNTLKEVTLYATAPKGYLFRSKNMEFIIIGPKIFQSESFDSLKLEMKNWIPFECPFRLCKTKELW